MTEASSASLSTSTFGRYRPPTGFFGRLAATLSLIAEALVEAQEMRRQARLRYPHLSEDC